MDSLGAPDPGDVPFDELHAESKAALGYAANLMGAITARYREAFHDQRGQYLSLREELDAVERRPRRSRAVNQAGLAIAGAGAIAPAADGAADRTGDGTAAMTEAAEAAEAGADDARLRALRRAVELLQGDVGAHQAELARFELAHRALESTWLFLERGDTSLVSAGLEGGAPPELGMLVVEAQEAERSRLAQEVHDGPAQALSNAIFQVEYIERVLDEDPGLAKSELKFMRELLRRELGDVRTFISQLRPPLLDELGLDGSIMDAAESLAALQGTTVETNLRAADDLLDSARQTVVLRVVQEALQNVRKHAKATRTSITTRTHEGRWIAEVSDNGRGFDAAAVAIRGRRNFGLQFMRERADLIGATFEVSSRPDGGTVVRLAVPIIQEGRGA